MGVDRSRREVEQELMDANESLSEQTCTNQALTSSKSKGEQEVSALSNDLDEMGSEVRMAEEKATRAMTDAARLAEELRVEQDSATVLERERKLLEVQVRDSAGRLSEVEQTALKGGRKALNKLETRIRELESEIDAENRRNSDAQKNLRKSERRIQELTFQQDEDQKNQERMQGLIDNQQVKIKAFKRQVEEAEEIAALNLAKFRQVQGCLLESSERAEVTEQAVAKLRIRGRSSSIGPLL